MLGNPYNGIKHEANRCKIYGRGYIVIIVSCSTEWAATEREMSHPVVELSLVRHQNLKTGKVTLLAEVDLPKFTEIFIIEHDSRSTGMREHTAEGGIAQAQSRARLPWRGALETSSAETSVVPIHSMYESTIRSIWRARAGRDESEAGR